MAKQLIITVHSTQKHKEVGYGGISKSIPGGKNLTEDEVIALKKTMTDAQRMENEEYKRKIRAGEPVEQKFFKREVAKVAGNPAAAAPNIVIPEAPLVVVDAHRTPFDLRLDAGTGNTMYIIGSTKRGKSTALMKIYDRYYADKQSVNILWTESPQIKMYRGHTNLIVADRWNEDSEAIVRSQHRIQTKTRNHYKFLNILDDVPHVRGSKIVEKMFMIFRNSKMSCIVSMQAGKQLMKNCRSNTSNVLLFGFNSDEDIIVVIECYLRGYLRQVGIKDLGDQVNWYKKMTMDHAFIYVHPSSGEVSFHRFQL